MNANDIYLTQSDKNHPLLISNNVTTFQPHWISGPPESLDYQKPTLCMFKFQHMVWPIPSSVALDENGVGLKIRLSAPMRAVTPGQVRMLIQLFLLRLPNFQYHLLYFIPVCCVLSRPKMPRKCQNKYNQLRLASAI